MLQNDISFHAPTCLQVYHSSIKVDPELTQEACGCPLLPLKSHIKGPAPTAEPGMSATNLIMVRSSPAYAFIECK